MVVIIFVQESGANFPTGEYNGSVEAFYNSPDGCFVDKVIGDCGTIENRAGFGFTTSPEVKQAALEQGYWIEVDEDGCEIYFDWTHDKNDPPNKYAIHI